MSEVEAARQAALDDLEWRIVKVQAIPNGTSKSAEERSEAVREIADCKARIAAIEAGG